MVDNPQMQDIQELTAADFTARTGIKVNFTVLPENELRSKVTQDIATGTGQYDVATIGAYEVPIWASNGWLHEMSSYAEADPGFDAADLLPSMTELLTSDDGQMYGMPFYGESSMLMYRKDVFEQRGLTMPERPTWDQVAQLAAQVDGALPGMKGICLRGLPGLGRGVRAADHGGEHLRRHLVHRGLAGAGQRARVRAGHAVLRRPGPRARRAGRRARRGSPSASTP